MLWDLTLPSLCETFAGKFKIGNIMSPWDLRDADFCAAFAHHYNAVTCENSMKPMFVAPEQGVFDFSDTDEIVRWAAENGIAVVGHTLIWHGQTSKWLNRHPDGTPLSRANARANLNAFIKSYVHRYRGKIFSWDVLNEMFIDSDAADYSGDWRDYVRRESDNERAVGHWFLAYANGAAPGEHGTDFIFDAFYFARKYDPAAILYCNEYNEEFENKTTAIADMVRDINNQWRAHPDYDGRLLIEGIGMQSHHSHEHSDIKKIRGALTRFAKLGVRISITELEFTFGSENKPAAPISDAQIEIQAQMYAELFALYIEFSHVIERVTFWGINDKRSWRAWGAPTLFDGNGQPKPAFYAVVNSISTASS